MPNDNAEKSGSASDTAVLNLEKALDDAENINLSLYVSSLRYIPLQTTKSSAIGKILHLCHNDGCFYISSIGSKEIAVFSESGEFIRKINRNGRGPGEYTRISGLFADYDADAKGAIGVLCQSAFVYDSEGRYIPNSESGSEAYDFFVLARVDPDGERIMREHGLLYADSADREILRRIILSERWRVNLAGYITGEELIDEVIEPGHILPQSSTLNRYTRMDAENYYVQAGDMHEIDGLLKEIRDRRGDSE